MGPLRDAIEYWVEANYYFRYGPNAYSAKAQERLTLAEAKLNWVVGGSEDPVVAAESIGVDVAAHKIRMKQDRKARERGLFT